MNSTKAEFGKRPASVHARKKYPEGIRRKLVSEWVQGPQPFTRR